MAMNKKEQAMVEDLKVMCALHFTNIIELDVEIPKPFANELSKGFMMNEYSYRVTKACSSSIGHSTSGDEKTTSQKGIKLYSTKMLALKAMRNAIELKCAKELRNIDIMIEKELGE